MLSQHEGSSSQAAELCCSQTEAKGGDEWGGHSACFKSFRDREEQQGLGGFGRAALEAPGICLADSRGRTSFGGPDLVLDTSPWPCWQLTWPRPPLTAVPTCPVICMTNSNHFYRKPSHWGCEGELWLVWAGACAAPVLSWGSVAINTSAGCWSSRGRAQPQSGIMSWHHLPSHPAAASKRQPCTPGGCCQTLPTCLPWRGMARVRFLPLPGTPSPWGVPCHRGTATGSAASCCLNLLLIRSRGYPAHTSAVLPPLSHVIWGTPGDTHGFLSRSRALQWHPQPVAIPRMRMGALGTWGALPAPTAQLPLANKPQHQNFAMRWKG